ncbi:MAG: hypothetical protein EOP11_20070 [Proteobacteria bacterium]|nr:MAG: hypothetical protein EOP11_20070 [Pseudomonadota bacterium]
MKLFSLILAALVLPAYALAARFRHPPVAPVCGLLSIEGPKYFLSLDGAPAPAPKLEVHSMTERTDAYFEKASGSREVCIDGKIIDGSVHALAIKETR